MTQEKQSKGKATDANWDKRWHLSTTEIETKITEIEFALFRNFFAFSRWMDDCTSCSHTGPHACNGMDYAILNIIRMHGRSKGVSEVTRLMNRDDISNVQYSFKKLMKAGLIEKEGSKATKRGARYSVTQEGREATDRYAGFRRELLLPLVENIKSNDKKLDDVGLILSLLSGIYDQAACNAASHRLSQADD